MSTVAVIMGSTSDLAVMSSAAELLEGFDVSHEVTVVSAHRTPERLYTYARGTRERGVRVIIAGAGGAAHLPGMVAALTTLPVIGVPVRGRSLEGIDSLLSIVQMPRGVPVATVAINNATNAALLALRILAIADDALADRLASYADRQRSEVEAQVATAAREGWHSLLPEQRPPGHL